MQVDQSDGPFSPVWNYFGYDEPNYTYAPNGKKLLGEFAALDAAPAYVRVHNLLTSGDGSASLKWGSTNVYSEDASGHPIYSWVILDQIFDTFRAAGVKPLVEIGFMPTGTFYPSRALSSRFSARSCQRHLHGMGLSTERLSEMVRTGFPICASSPRALRRCRSEAHGCGKYGTNLTLAYWKGTREEYFKLYDFTVDAVLRALARGADRRP